MNQKILYPVFLLLVILTSCFSLNEKNNYVLSGSSKWIFYEYDDENGLGYYMYYFSDSVRALASIKKKSEFNTSYLYFRWREFGSSIFSTFLFIPIFPDFLFYDPEEKIKPHLELSMGSRNDSINIDLKRVKFLSNDRNILSPIQHPEEESLTYIDSTGNIIIVDMHTIGQAKVKIRKYRVVAYPVVSSIEASVEEMICKDGGKESTIDSNEIGRIKYIDFVSIHPTLNVDSDSIMTLSVIFDSVEVKGKKVYVEPLKLKQEKYREMEYIPFPR